MSDLPPIADPLDGDGLGSYDTDELDAIAAAWKPPEGIKGCYATGFQPKDADRYAQAVARIVAEADLG